MNFLKSANKLRTTYRRNIIITEYDNNAIDRNLLKVGYHKKSKLYDGETVDIMNPKCMDSFDNKIKAALEYDALHNRS